MPSSQYLTHKIETFNGCTIGEMVVLCTLIFGIGLALAAISSLFIGKFFLNALLIFLANIFVVKQLSKMLGKYKQNKAPGHVTLILYLLLEKVSFGLFKTPHVRRNGSWRIGGDNSGTI